MVESSLGQPPFEQPSIHKAISNLLVYKFSHLAQQEWKTICEVARILLHCLNTWELPSPSTQRQVISQEEASVYKIDHTRWLVFCNVPTFCDSLKHYDTTMVFGRTLLRAIFKYMKKQIMDQFNQEREKMPQEQRVMLLTHFPPFLNQLDEEIYAHDSPIWDNDFKQPSVHFQPLLESGRVKSVGKRSLDGDKDKSKSGEVKKKKVDEQFEDISMDTVAQIIATIDDPNYMNGPDVIIFLFGS